MSVSLSGSTYVVLFQPMDNEDHTIFRFLRARKMNVEAAADMLQSKDLKDLLVYTEAMQHAANFPPSSWSNKQYKACCNNFPTKSVAYKSEQK